MPLALLSVSDKTGLIDFANGLLQRGWALASTGGTARALREAGVPVTDVSELTHHPEMMDGRVKTLHPAVHAGLLGRAEHEADTRQMTEMGYRPIDLLAVNLYPFRETITRENVTFAEAVEQIDIGGPAMLRSAAKNHDRVWVIVDPADYDTILAALDGGGDEPALRRELARRVFSHTSAYDSAIAAYLARSDEPRDSEVFPPALTLDLTLVQSLRYGENPGQRAAFYRDGGTTGGLPAVRQLHGKELSFNNLLDVDGALLAISGWSKDARAACAIVKHTTPCGVAVADDPEDAYRRALATDQTSAFGSVVAFNREVTEGCAALLRPNFVEAIVAPGFADGALALLREKKNVRLLVLPPDGSGPALDYKGVRGGLLVQDRLRWPASETDWRIVTKRGPDAREMDDLRFAWRAIAAVKSNAILIAKDGASVGIGAGQMSRVDSSRIAVMKATENGFDLTGAVLASDAFFPFRDGVDAAARAGVSAIVQPGGSLRDEEVIEAADEHRIAMVFTGERVFRH